MTEHKCDTKAKWVDRLIQRAAERLAPSDEAVWIQEKFDSFGVKYGLARRQDIDRLIYQKLTGRCPERDSQLLKIRYWRTGRHKPQSREQCLQLGKALNLEKEDLRYMLQAYYDSADRIFDKGDEKNPVYQERLRLFGELEQQYLINAHPDILTQMGVPWNRPEPYLRHYYFQDAANYVSGVRQGRNSSHISSANYVNEFQKSRRLQGEIPRRTILRHLFIMGAPFLSKEVMNSRLTALGYAPLSEGHESRWGERVDCLILGLLEQYSAECTGKSPVQCLAWLQNTSRFLDQRLVDVGHPELRFLYFKALGN